MRFTPKKTVLFTNLARKTDKNKQRASEMIAEIAFHMLHNRSNFGQQFSFKIFRCLEATRASI